MEEIHVYCATWLLCMNMDLTLTLLCPSEVGKFVVLVLREHYAWISGLREPCQCHRIQITMINLFLKYFGNALIMYIRYWKFEINPLWDLMYMWLWSQILRLVQSKVYPIYTTVIKCQFNKCGFMSGSKLISSVPASSRWFLSNIVITSFVIS